MGARQIAFLRSVVVHTLQQRKQDIDLQLADYSTHSELEPRGPPIIEVRLDHLPPSVKIEELVESPESSADYPASWASDLDDEKWVRMSVTWQEGPQTPRIYRTVSRSLSSLMVGP